MNLNREQFVIRNPDRVDLVLPDTDPKAKGHRLHLSRDTDVAGYVLLAEERTLPEKVGDVHARVVSILDEVCLSMSQVRWLRDRLDEILSLTAGEG